MDCCGGMGKKTLPILRTSGATFYRDRRCHSMSKAPGLFEPHLAWAPLSPLFEGQCGGHGGLESLVCISNRIYSLGIMQAIPLLRFSSSIAALNCVLRKQTGLRMLGIKSSCDTVDRLIHLSFSSS